MAGIDPLHDVTDFVIDEISLVDDPMNPHAFAEIFKRRRPPEAGTEAASVLAVIEKALAAGDIDPNTAATATAFLKELNMTDNVTAALAAAESRMDDLEKSLASKDEAIAARDAEIAKLRGKVGPTDEDDAEMLKSLPPALRARLERAAESEVELAKMREQRDTDAAIAKARAIGIGDPVEVGGILVRVAKGQTTTADADKLESLLKAGAARSNPRLFEVIGGHGADLGDPVALLKSKVEEVRKAKPGLTPEAAETEVLSATPGLYEAVTKARTAAA